MLLEEIDDRGLRQGIKDLLGKRAELREKGDRIDEAVERVNFELELLVSVLDEPSVSDPDLGSVTVVENKPRKSTDLTKFKLYLAEKGVSVDVITACEDKATSEKAPGKPTTVRYTPPKG